MVSSCLQDVAGIGSAKTEALEIVECLMAPARCDRIAFDRWSGSMETRIGGPGLQAWGRAAPKACFSQDHLGVERRAASLFFFVCGELLT